jgi:hypothetical protein
MVAKANPHYRDHDLFKQETNGWTEKEQTTIMLFFDAWKRAADQSGAIFDANVVPVEKEPSFRIHERRLMDVFPDVNSRHEGVQEKGHKAARHHA